MFNLAARTDGKKPPNNPMNAAKMNDDTIIDGDSANEKDKSAKELKLSVDILKNCRNDAKANPITQPNVAIASDSTKNAASILLWLNPSARIVPISTVRLATAASLMNWFKKINRLKEFPTFFRGLCYSSPKFALNRYPLSRRQSL